MAAPRKQERTEPYFDVRKACELIKINKGLDTYAIQALYDDYIKQNPDPDDYVSYQTFINWNKKGFKQIKVWIKISIMAKCSLIDLITIPE